LPRARPPSPSPGQSEYRKQPPQHPVAYPSPRAEVEAKFAEGTWQRQAYDAYTATLLDKDRVFPCVYAAKGYKGDEQRFLFIDTDDLGELRHAEALAAAFDAYLPISHDLGPNTSLVLLARENPQPREMEEYLDGFWKLLNNLAVLDRTAWPNDIPKDIDTDKWCLCYGGEPLFTAIQTPAHQKRASRYSAGVTIAFQPKWICQSRAPSRREHVLTCLRSRHPLQHRRQAPGRDPKGPLAPRQVRPDAVEPGAEELRRQGLARGQAVLPHG
jgi:FPC/CPF motif-containing protein YcgG